MATASRYIRNSPLLTSPSRLNSYRPRPIQSTSAFTTQSPSTLPHLFSRTMSFESPKHKYEHLLSPITVGSVPLRNRVIMAALTRDRSVPTNVPNDLNLEYYRQRAKGGAGLIVTEGTLIVPQGAEWQNAPGIWSDEHVVAWRKITEAVHAEGAKIFCQVWHLGRVAHPDAPEQKKSGRPVYAPSNIPAEGGKFRFLPGIPGYVPATPLEDPWIIIEDFRKAAINAKEAGFDGVELHGANGYLIHQFLDNTVNNRTDEWGGSVENRARFGLEVLKALASVWGADKVGVRISPAGGYNDMGMTLEDTLATYSYFVKSADALGLAYIDLIRYTSQIDYKSPKKNDEYRGTVHDVLASYGPLIKKAKRFLNAALTPDEANELIKDGKIDAGVFGRAWIGNPDVVRRLEQGIELNMNIDFKSLYGGGSIGAEGYTDYPFAT